MDKKKFDDPNSKKITEHMTALMLDRWEDFISQMEENDKLWSFSSTRNTWGKKMGSSGFLIIRNDIVIDKYITMMN